MNSTFEYGARNAYSVIYYKSNPPLAHLRIDGERAAGAHGLGVWVVWVLHCLGPRQLAARTGALHQLITHLRGKERLASQPHHHTTSRFTLRVYPVPFGSTTHQSVAETSRNLRKTKQDVWETQPERVLITSETKVVGIGRLLILFMLINQTQEGRQISLNFIYGF